jgi:hypothetical protein
VRSTPEASNPSKASPEGKRQASKECVSGSAAAASLGRKEREGQKGGRGARLTKLAVGACFNGCRLASSSSSPPSSPDAEAPTASSASTTMIISSSSAVTACCCCFFFFAS